MLCLATEKFESELLNIDLEIYQDDGGEFWFHGPTICNIFDLSNPSQSIQRHVDDDWRKKFPATHGKESWYVMEPGFYQLLHVSKHPAAKRFQRWVYGTVLKKLRADGGYIMPNATSEQIQGLMAQIGVLEARSEYLQRKKRLMYPLFKEIAAFNHPKIVDKKASNEEKWQAQNELEIKRRDIYIACCDAWESSPSRISVSLTLEEVDRFLPPEIKVPWRNAAIPKKRP